MTGPFLLLTTRPEASEAAEEHRCFLRATGLTASLLEHRRLGEGAGTGGTGVTDVLDLRRYSGVLLGGSPYNYTTPAAAKSARQRAVESELVRLVERMRELRLPLFGACHGIGVLTSALGGAMGTEHPEITGVARVAVTPVGAADPLLAGFPDEFPVVVGHRESCSRMPAGAELLVGGAACPVQMFRVDGHLYATQFHPELDHPSLAGRMHTYRDHGYFAPEEYDAILAEAARHDLAIAPRMLRAFVTHVAASVS